MTTLVNQKIEAVLKLSYEMLDEETKADFAAHPGTTMAMEGNLVVFSCNGRVYCTVEKSWLEDDSNLLLSQPEIIDGHVPDVIPDDFDKGDKE